MQLFELISGGFRGSLCYYINFKVIPSENDITEDELVL